MRGLTCDLHPGDVLFVPAFWSMHTELLTKPPRKTSSSSSSNIGATVGFGSSGGSSTGSGSIGSNGTAGTSRAPFRRHSTLRVQLAYGPCGTPAPHSRGALLLHASRVIEAYAGAEMPPGSIRTLLLTQAQVWPIGA